ITGTTSTAPESRTVREISSISSYSLERLRSLRSAVVCQLDPTPAHAFVRNRRVERALRPVHPRVRRRDGRLGPRLDDLRQQTVGADSLLRRHPVLVLVAAGARKHLD